MGLRITTWNVNGIRNPFQYQPWRGKKTFEAMFNILEADIVVLQETKIQKKDLRDDMVLVEGWDCYWSLPRNKKGYSGVVIYTRQSVCAPVRAEEGITGILCPPNSSTCFSNLPEDQKIGGYPTYAQLTSSAIDASTIDSEGRCVILEFPAFVLLGVYSPANRDESRDEFRIGFLNLLDARIRNLMALGKRVILMGDLNVSREQLDTANAESSIRKNGLSVEEYMSMPYRRLLNQLLEGGKVLGERDEGREKPVMLDICRAFHPDRNGMFTCWEQKTNARPGNYGARIDYVICSSSMKDWFSDSNIQEGLMGSDHCPVYATINMKVMINGDEVHLLDIMNPPGMFFLGNRQREYSTKDILPLSGKLIPEFDGRRSIREMFSRKSFTSQLRSKEVLAPEKNVSTALATFKVSSPSDQKSQAENQASGNASSIRIGAANVTSPTSSKRSLGEVSANKSLKRVRPSTIPITTSVGTKSQQSLTGFFKPKLHINEGTIILPSNSKQNSLEQNCPQVADITESNQISGMCSQDIAINNPVCCESRPFVGQSGITKSPLNNKSPRHLPKSATKNQDDVHDPIETKESWSKLFTKPVVPRCEGHNEPCISLLTKKGGINCGRSFWMCSRPLGPTGAKEKNTQWRCQTFIWCSDWNSVAKKTL